MQLVDQVCFSVHDRPRRQESLQTRPSKEPQACASSIIYERHILSNIVRTQASLEGSTSQLWSLPRVQDASVYFANLQYLQCCRCHHAAKAQTMSHPRAAVGTVKGRVLWATLAEYQAVVGDGGADLATV